MMKVGRGVAGKLTEAGNDVCEHGPAAAHALRQHGEHPALEFHQGRRPGAPVTDLCPLSRTVEGDLLLRCGLKQYSGEIAVAVRLQSVHSHLDGRTRDRGHNRNLDAKGTINEIWATWAWTQSFKGGQWHSLSSKLCSHIHRRRVGRARESSPSTEKRITYMRVQPAWLITLGAHTSPGACQYRG